MKPKLKLKKPELLETNAEKILNPILSLNLAGKSNFSHSILFFLSFKFLLLKKYDCRSFHAIFLDYPCHHQKRYRLIIFKDYIFLKMFFMHVYDYDSVLSRY